MCTCVHMNAKCIIKHKPENIRKKIEGNHIFHLFSGNNFSQLSLLMFTNDLWDMDPLKYLAITC